MPKHPNDRLQGTLDLLILKTLARAGSLHGYAMARRIHQATDDSLQIEEGSLYPALQRMTHEKWLRAHWGTTDTGRQARFHHISNKLIRISSLNVVEAAGVGSSPPGRQPLRAWPTPAPFPQTWDSSRRLRVGNFLMAFPVLASATRSSYRL